MQQRRAGHMGVSNVLFAIARQCRLLQPYCRFPTSAPLSVCEHKSGVAHNYRIVVYPKRKAFYTMYK